MIVVCGAAEVERASIRELKHRTIAFLFLVPEIDRCTLCLECRCSYAQVPLLKAEANTGSTGVRMSELLVRAGVCCPIDTAGAVQLVRVPLAL